MVVKAIVPGAMTAIRNMAEGSANLCVFFYQATIHVQHQVTACALQKQLHANQNTIRQQAAALLAAGAMSTIIIMALVKIKTLRAYGKTLHLEET